MNLPKHFKIYLESQEVSPITIKNYLSDINNFLDWLHQTTGINYLIAGKSIFAIFTRETLEEYQNHLVKENVPRTTINRRFSTLRKLGQFAQTQRWMKKNSAEEIKNLPEERKPLSESERLLPKFKSYLEREKVSPLTIKNYLSDLRHFLNWLEAT